jgi:uncharacterized protein YjbJ (UPF0337 family)
MDKDRVKGKMEDVKGRIKRQVGEWTGDEETQANQQVKGKIQNAWGKAKDRGRDVLDRSTKSSGKQPSHKKDDSAA